MEAREVCIDGTLAHHWIIEPSKGTASVVGICKKCQQNKLFDSSMRTASSWREASIAFKQKRDVEKGT